MPDNPNPNPLTQPETTRSLYQDLIAANCEVGNHESDLHIKSTPEALAIVQAHGQKYIPFTSALDNLPWLDVPFAFDPYWIEKGSNPPVT